MNAITIVPEARYTSPAHKVRQTIWESWTTSRDAVQHITSPAGVTTAGFGPIAKLVPLIPAGTEWFASAKLSAWEISGEDIQVRHVYLRVNRGDVIISYEYARPTTKWRCEGITLFDARFNDSHMDYENIEIGIVPGSAEWAITAPVAEVLALVTKNTQKGVIANAKERLVNAEETVAKYVAEAEYLRDLIDDYGATIRPRKSRATVGV